MRLRHIGFIIFSLVIACACDTAEQEKARAIEKIKARIADSLKRCEGGSTSGEAPESEIMAKYRRWEEAKGIALERRNFVLDSIQKDFLDITRAEFPEFTLVLHQFRGYMNEYEDWGDVREREYSIAFFDRAEATVKDEWVENDSLGISFRKEIILAKKDTLHLAEDMDERIDNTLIEIIPKNSEDRFRLSFSYQAALNEVIDYRQHKREKWEKLYANAKSFTMFTSLIELRDSAAYFFRILPDMGGEINYAGRQDWEEAYFKKEIAAVKEKYAMRDTAVTIPAEYDRYANLHKGKRLFNFWYHSYFIRIDRISKGRIVETRYLHIGIQYGC
jgi:hypothetical protein